MKIVFEVEKEYKGKVYFPGVAYEVSKEVAEDILRKTRFAHVESDDVECYEDCEVSEEVVGAVASAIVEEAKTREVEVETIVNELVDEFNEDETTDCKKNKKSKRNAQ